MGTDPTIYDVARRAGVSLATVSRVLRHRSNVRLETRERVLQAMTELAYQPNLLASALMTKQTNTIGLLVPDISNPFFAEICRGVEDACASAGFNLVICNTDEDGAKQRQQIALLRQKGVDGIILASVKIGDQDIVDLHRSKYPMVLLTRSVAGLNLPGVCVDDFQGGYMATRYLLELGHQTIALLTGDLSTRPALFRKKGFEAAIEQAGLPADPGLVESGPFTIQGGTTMAERLLAHCPAHPTAFVAGNDMIAIGAIRVLKQRGMRVPEDVSVVGFDRTVLAQIVDPPLTSVAQPTHELGANAVQLLLERLNNPVVAPRQITLPPMLVPGASTTTRTSR